MKAEHFERQLQRAEQEREAWEKKFEVSLSPTLGIAIIIIMTIYQDSEAKYRKSQKELEELEASMQDL